MQGMSQDKKEIKKVGKCTCYFLISCEMAKARDEGTCRRRLVDDDE